MKTVVLVCMFLIATCFAENNKSTVLQQRLKLQKREKQYLIEDDPSQPELKRDERQSTPDKSNNNPIDLIGNARMLNIRLQPTQKQVLKPGSMKKSKKYRVDTSPNIMPAKVPVVMKTGRVHPSPAHALRLKLLENKFNDSLTNMNKEKTLCQSNIGPSTLSTDKSGRRIDDLSSPHNIDDEKPNIESNGNIPRDDKETSDDDGKNHQSKADPDYINKGKNDQVPLNLDRKATFGKNGMNSNTPDTTPKLVNFFVDEPEPLPESFRRQQNYENTVSQNKEVTPNKLKEFPRVKKKKNKPIKEETEKKDKENDDETDEPNIVTISNGTHLINIKKIENHDGHKIDRLGPRGGDGNTVLTEERIVNHEPPTPQPKTDEPEKHTFNVTENTVKEKKMGSAGLELKDYKNKEEKDQNQYITITKHNYEECEEKSPITPTIALHSLNPPKALNEGNQESRNYIQNPNYYPYYKNMYDQCTKYGLAQSTLNIYGQEITDPRNFGAQINPRTYNNPYAFNSKITLPYYPNGNPPVDPDSDSSKYPYDPNNYEIQPGIETTLCPPRTEITSGISPYPENSLDRIWRAWKDVEIKIKNAQTNNSDKLFDIDIRRQLDEMSDGNKGENAIGTMANPYETTSLPINLNGALIYPYVKPGYRYLR